MLNIAHRGASGNFIENTIESFSLGISMGADIIEMDIRLCKSGNLVVYHDSAYKGKLIDDMTKDECIDNDILMLDDVLNRYSHRTSIYLDLKTPFIYDKEQMNLYIGKIVEMMINCKKNNLFNERRLILASFDHLLIKHLKSVLNLHNINPKFGLIFYNNPINFFNYDNTLCDFIIQSINSMNMPFLKYTHSHNMKYLVYTVNSEEMMKKLIEIKIDGIITDYPDKLSKLL